MTSAEIITIGTEILLGEIVDTNTRYLAQNLRGLGVDLYRTITIGDNEERIASAIRESMERANQTLQDRLPKEMRLLGICSHEGKWKCLPA